LFATSDKVYVSCAPEFWRYGNVEIVCQRHGIPLHPTLQELLGATLPLVQGAGLSWR
jgi:hypothetical protein